MNNFPTTWTPNPRYGFAEPPKKRGGGRFLICIFVGAVVGLFLSVVAEANIWLPASVTITLLLCALEEGSKG